MALRSTFQRARSVQAKVKRENAILDAARVLAEERSVREVTLTDIAGAIGMHKSALLRYFETREEIFLRLAADGWREWSAAQRGALASLDNPTARKIASAFADGLSGRPLFCDLLVQSPLNLERKVSVEAVRSFKLVAMGEVDAIADALKLYADLTEREAVDFVTTAVNMAGTLWQIASLGPGLRQVLQDDPKLANAIIEVAPQLQRILEGLLLGYMTKQSNSDNIEK